MGRSASVQRVMVPILLSGNQNQNDKDDVEDFDNIKLHHSLRYTAARFAPGSLDVIPHRPLAGEIPSACVGYRTELRGLIGPEGEPTGALPEGGIT